MQESINGQSVAIQTESAYHSKACGADGTMMTKLLTLVHIANMYLYHRSADSLDCIQEGNAIVCISTSVEHYAIVVKAHLVYLID